MAAALAAYEPLTVPDAGMRRSAVLVPLVLDPDGVRVILTRRTDDLSSHAGQVSFPGGRVDATDASATQAALRETHEELGVDPDQITMLGRLDEIITVTHYHVTPVVGTLPASTVFHPNPAEVARVLRVPLAQLLDGERWERGARKWQGVTFKMWQFTYEDDLIWGATAMMLRQFVELLWTVKI